SGGPARRGDRLQMLAGGGEGIQGPLQVRIEPGQVVLRLADAFGHLGEDRLPAVQVAFESLEGVVPGPLWGGRDRPLGKRCRVPVQVGQSGADAGLDFCQETGGGGEGQAGHGGTSEGGGGGLRARDIAWIGRLGKAVLSIFCLRLPTRMVMRIGRPGGTGRPRLGAPRRGTTVYVACSSLCFGRYPLAQALHTISELNFHKVDLALHESGPHVQPSQVVADVNKVAQVLRKANVAYAAFHVQIAAADADQYKETLRAVCRLGRVLAVPLVNIPAAPLGSDFNAEVARLTGLTRLAESEGVMLT